MAPTIGITTYHTNADWRGWSEEGALLPWNYVTSVRKNGGRPVLLPPGGDAAEAEATVAVLDGLIIAGGGDIDPAIYGAAKHPQTEATVLDRDAGNWPSPRPASARAYPCSASAGARRCSTSPAAAPSTSTSLTWSGTTPTRGPIDGFGTHKVRVTSGTVIASILPGGEFFEVPTHHHQAVDIVGAGLTAVAWADDGIVEGIESTTAGEFLVGVQWHPEQGTDPRLFTRSGQGG